MNTMCKDCWRLNHGCEGDSGDIYTGCLLKIRKDGLVLPVLSDYFKGYDVPFFLKVVVSHIMRRFDIFGSCDGMYIANVIAHESGTGDGCGHFTSGAVKNHWKIVKKLQKAYGCNINLWEMTELENMLHTGRIYPESAIRDLKLRILFIRKEKPFESGGRYSQDYINLCVHNIADVIDELTGRLPKGYTPDYYKA